MRVCTQVFVCVCVRVAVGRGVRFGGGAHTQQCVMDVLLQSFPYGARSELAAAEARLHGSPSPEVHKEGL